jgi:hypothetical protein
MDPNQRSWDFFSYGRAWRALWWSLVQAVVRFDGPEDPRAKVSGAVEPQLSTLPSMRHCEEVDRDLSADQLGWLDTEVDYILEPTKSLISAGLHRLPLRD